MKRLITVTLFSCVIFMFVAEVIYAGNLDRQNVQPRTNDATKSMIRVPGVVGQSQAYAMSALQQAGLAVSVLEAKKMPKGMEGAANMEGKVVSQTPGSGGMAMYGTAVNIYIWKPKEAPSEGYSENPTGTSGWGNNNSSSYNQTQSTYSGTQTQPQMYQPQMGTTGTTTQQSQPFQVQKYYYPPAGDASTSTQQNQTNQVQQTQTSDPNASQQPAGTNTYQQPVDTNTYQQPVDPNASQPAADTNTQQPSDDSKKQKSSNPTEQQTTTPAK